MEFTSIRDHLKYINANGHTFSIEERINLDLALQKLQLDFGFEELLLWGKVSGNHISDYLLFLQVLLTITTWQLA
jgi:hypothetical protein